MFWADCPGRGTKARNVSPYKGVTKMNYQHVVERAIQPGIVKESKNRLFESNIIRPSSGRIDLKFQLKVLYHYAKETIGLIKWNGKHLLFPLENWKCQCLKITF